jgi:uncharacterized protein YodC (DUF2158 family)
MAVATGDVVKLKSGGPSMTVAGDVPGKTGFVYCYWFTGALQQAMISTGWNLQSEQFPASALEVFSG